MTDVQNELAKEARAATRSATVSPRAAAFALLGMINWIYQWYKPEGDLQAQQSGSAIHRSDFRRNSRVKAMFANLAEIERQRAQSGKPYREFLRVPAMSTGLYVLAAGATDPQSPHHEDEMYYVLRGRARFRAADRGPGNFRRKRSLCGRGG